MSVETLTEKQFQEKKKFFKKKLHEALNGCNFNGSGMRELIGEFTDEVCGG